MKIENTKKVSLRYCYAVSPYSLASQALRPNVMYY